MKWFLAILSGLLYAFGFAGFVHPAFAWIALVPIFFALTDLRPRQAFFVGWLAGFTAHAFCFYWIVRTVVVFGELPLSVAVLAHVVLALAQSAQFGCFALLFAWLKDRGGSSPFLIAPLAWVISEFLYPHLFPSYFANSQYTWTTLVQVADMTGPLGISALLVFVNAGIFVIMKTFMRERHIAWRSLAALLLLPLIVLAYGTVRLSAIERAVTAAPKLKVGIVQTNIGLGEKHHEPLRNLQRSLEGAQMLTERGAELIVWPETAVTAPFIPTGSVRAPAELTRALTVPLLTGVIEETPGVRPSRDYNAAALIMPDGRIAGMYRKQVLLLFGEYLPFGDFFPRLYDWLPTVGRFSAGDADQPIPWRDGGLGVTICYEDILPRLVRRIMRHEPVLLINMSNDSWFGDTREPLIHLALATFRSVEERRATVRSTNTGISAFIDPAGRIVARTPQFAAALLMQDVPLLSGRTIYNMMGDWVGYLAIGMVLLLMIRGRPWLR